MTVLRLSRWLMLLIIIGSVASACTGNDKAADQPAVPPTPNADAKLAAWDGTCNPQLDDQGYYTPDNFKIALLCSVPDYSWPAAYKPDERLIEEFIMLDDLWSTTLFEPEYVSVQMAGPFATCAWAAEYQDAVAAKDATRQSTAVTFITQYGVNPDQFVPGYPSDGMDESARNHMSSLVEKLSVGDPAGITEIMDSGCAMVPWPTPEAGE